MLLGAIIVLALGVTLPPLINIGRYQRRIAASIGRSVGRSVHMSSVTLRLLPLPAFELSDFWVEEDPHYGAEPILRSSSVIAYLRLLSLWRGKLEIARIHFDDASLNLVRAPDGSWNFGSVLVQAAHTANAPTGQRYAGSTPRFPYIEATNARINFKRGAEKMPLSFLNSDLSVWLENPDEWGVHFRAQPARTDLDLDLSDTGLLRIDGSLRRAATLTEMPVNLHVEWSSAPLGQLSRLTVGRDIGWRGDLDIRTEIAGSVGLARLKTRIEIDGLHRAEFVPSQPLDLETTCQASYQKVSRSLEEIACASPVGTGELVLSGYMRQTESQAETELNLGIHRLPASAVLAGLQEMRQGWANGIQAVGELDGQFTFSSTNDGPLLPSGQATARSLTLTLPNSARPFSLNPVRFSFDKHETAPGSSSSVRPSGAPASQPALLLQPMRLSLGEPSPLSIDGRFTLSGFDLHLAGSGAIARLRGLSRILSGDSGSRPAWPGSAGVALGSTGIATLDVNVHGPWLLPVADSDHPVMPSITEGTILIKNVELNAPYLSRTLKIGSALGTIHPTDVAWTDASFSYGTLEAQGALDYPTLCAPGVSCSAQFALATPSLNAGELQSTLLGSDRSGEILQELLNRIDHHPVLWPRLSGTFEIGDLSAGKLVFHDATGDVAIAGNSMQIRSLDARLLNGSVHLAGTLDATGDQPEYAFTGQIKDASLTGLSALSAEHWGGGAANFTAQWKMAGLTAQDLAQSVTGAVHWDWTKGTLGTAAPSFPSTQALAHFDEWSGDATIQDSVINIEQSRMTRGAEAIPLSGTITFDRRIDLTSSSEPRGLSMTGTLEHPRVRGPGSIARTEPAKVVSR
jgi:AsmA-like C-terminal region/AsmA family